MGDKGEEMTASPLDAAHETTRRITTVSVATAVLLIVMKAFALGASGSVSILASLADSALDLVASLATFFAVRWAAAPPDDDHRYGHGKAEGLASLVQAGMVLGRDDRELRIAARLLEFDDPGAHRRMPDRRTRGWQHSTADDRDGPHGTMLRLTPNA